MFQPYYSFHRNYLHYYALEMEKNNIQFSTAGYEFLFYVQVYVYLLSTAKPINYQFIEE